MFDRSDRLQIVLGANGLLGRSIVKIMNVPAENLITRNTYFKWSNGSNEHEILKDLIRFDLSKADIFVAAGITDSRVDPALLWSLNYHLPKNLISSTANLGSRIITFGTIHESFTINNEYFASKRALGNFVRNTQEFNNARHFLLHTLYSDDPPPEHMFLGQMFKALKTGVAFNMSNGKQLREFHHVDDITKAVFKLLQSTESRSQDISTGSGMQIRKLAEEIFFALGVSDDLHLGTFPPPVGDNFDRVFTMTNGLELNNFRDPIKEIPEIFKRLLDPK
jgi:nucleoside-diphosphate-sugar epimerase